MTTPARTEAKRARKIARKTARNHKRAPIPAKKITVHVRGGVAYCDSPAVRIIDHDNR